MNEDNCANRWACIRFDCCFRNASSNLRGMKKTFFSALSRVDAPAAFFNPKIGEVICIETELSRAEHELVATLYALKFKFLRLCSVAR